MISRVRSLWVTPKVILNDLAFAHGFTGTQNWLSMLQRCADPGLDGRIRGIRLRSASGGLAMRSKRPMHPSHRQQSGQRLGGLLGSGCRRWPPASELTLTCTKQSLDPTTALARMAAVRGTAVAGLRRCDPRRATGRFPIAWTCGIDPMLSVMVSCSNDRSTSGDRGRKRRSPSPPSEPAVRFSRDGLSSQLFPHRDWRAN